MARLAASSAASLKNANDPESTRACTTRPRLVDQSHHHHVAAQAACSPRRGIARLRDLQRLDADDAGIAATEERGTDAADAAGAADAGGGAAARGGSAAAACCWVAAGSGRALLPGVAELAESAGAGAASATLGGAEGSGGGGAGAGGGLSDAGRASTTTSAA